MRHTYLIILLIGCTHLSSQCQPNQPYEFIILDQVSGQACSYAHIGYIGTQQGTIADENGRIKINAEDIVSDSIYIQMVGYKKRHMTFEEIADTIYLESNVITISEVVISSSRKTYKVGGQDPRKKAIPWVAHEMLGTEIGTYFNELPPDKVIDAVNVFVRKNRCDSILLRVRFYEASDDNSLKEKLDHTDIITNIRSQKGWVKIPLDNQVIRARPKMLVTIEALRTWGNKRQAPDFTLCHDKRHTGLAASRRYSDPRGFGNYAFKGKGLAMYLDLVE